MRYLFSNLPAENFLPNDAKYVAMGIGLFSFHGPGRVWGFPVSFHMVSTRSSSTLKSVKSHYPIYNAMLLQK